MARLAAPDRPVLSLRPRGAPRRRARVRGASREARICATLLGVMVLLLLVLAPGASTPALAFQRSMTCGPQSRFVCDPGESPKTVQWSSSCVVVHLDAAGSAELPFDEIERVTRLTLELWTRVECSEMTAIFGGFTDEDRVGFNPYSGDNANVLTFRDDRWDHERGVLALTSVTFDQATGEIVDADIEFNTHDFAFTSTENAITSRIDLQNTMLHELGHLLGLDHTQELDATMFGSAPEGEIKKRSLHPDDIAGICDTYPPGVARPVCNRHTIGFYEAPALALDEAPPEDCSIASPRTGTRTPLGLALGTLALCALLAGLVCARSRPCSELERG